MRSCSRSEAGVVATTRFGLIGAADGAEAEGNEKRLMSPQPASATGALNSTAATQTRRLIPLSRRPADPSTSDYSSWGHDLFGRPLHTLRFATFGSGSCPCSAD